MAKKKTQEPEAPKPIHAPRAPAPIADPDGQFLIPGVKPEPPAPPSARVWTWPGKARCPRCGSTETQRVSDDGPTQYRKCTRAICRHPFKVQGTAV